MKVKTKAFVIYHANCGLRKDGTPYISLLDFDGSKYNTDLVAIRHQEFEVEIPDDFDPRPKQIEALKAEARKVKAEAHKKITEIEDAISKLTAIEDKREVVS